MHKNLRKSFENERKIERRSFDIERERERKAAEKLNASASGAQNVRLSASASNFFERTKALLLHFSIEKRKFKQGHYMFNVYVNVSRVL